MFKIIIIILNQFLIVLSLMSELIFGNYVIVWLYPKFLNCTFLFSLLLKVLFFFVFSKLLALLKVVSKESCESLPNSLNYTEFVKRKGSLLFILTLSIFS